MSIKWLVKIGKTNIICPNLLLLTSLIKCIIRRSRHLRPEIFETFPNSSHLTTAETSTVLASCLENVWDNVTGGLGVVIHIFLLRTFDYI